MRRLLLVAGALAGAAAGGWRYLVCRTGDPRFEWVARELADVRRDGRTLSGTIGIVNRGTALGVVRKVEGRVVTGGPGRVLVTLQGSAPPERGFWVSNFLDPGESCVAEVDVELEAEHAGPVTVELTAQELGRRLFQYRRAEVAVPEPAPAKL